MTGAHENTPADAELTAFLDGELSDTHCAAVQHWLQNDQGTRDRLALIEHGGRQFRAAFNLVLEHAPEARLSAMLAALPRSSAARKQARSWSPMAAVAAIPIMLGLGLAVGHWIPRGSTTNSPPATETAKEAPENWRQTVAEYFNLQSPATLAAIPDDSRMRLAELAAASSQLGLALSPPRLSIPNFTFKRAELFTFRGMPLTEILYVDSKGEPAALCIIANGKSDETFRTERREGLNIVYWQRKRRGFLLIGRAPASELKRQAQKIAQRLSS